MLALRSGETTGRIVRSCAFNGVIVSTTRSAPSTRAPDPHYHESAHLCLIVHGTDVETRSGRSYRRQPGDLHFYHAGESHASTVCSKRLTSALVEFGECFLSRYQLTEDQLARAVHENSFAPFLVLQLQHELLQNDVHTPLGLDALSLELVNYSRERFELVTPPWVSTVAQMLKDHVHAPLGLGELAAACGVHPVTISRQFRRYFSCSLSEYRRRIMVRRSLQLVDDASSTLRDVAFACGFADQSHFIRAFRRVTHFSPSEYRHL